MILSVVSVLVVAQSSSEVPEGLMNNPVYMGLLKICLKWRRSAYNTEVLPDFRAGYILNTWS